MRGGVRTNRPFPFPVRALRGHEGCPYLDVGSQVGKQTRDGARGLKRVLVQCSHSCLYVWWWLPLGSVKCIVKVLRVRGKVWGRGGVPCVTRTVYPRHKHHVHIQRAVHGVLPPPPPPLSSPPPPFLWCAHTALHTHTPGRPGTSPFRKKAAVARDQSRQLGRGDPVPHPHDTTQQHQRSSWRSNETGGAS
jgi:hypothetical protein